MTEVEYATLPNGDKVPRYLYRYLAINENLYTSVSEKYLWFTDPELFNDPYDCNVKLSNTVTDQTVADYLQVVNTINHVWDETTLAERISYYQSNKDEVVTLLNEEIKSVQKKCAVCCFSECSNIMLMWAHYTEKHSGVCLKFDIKADSSIFKSSSLIKVKYHESYPQFDFMQYVISSKGIPTDNRLTQFVAGIKSNTWAYEKEIRLVRWEKFHNPFKGKVEFNKDALIGAYFGYKTDCEKINKVINTLRINGYPLKEIKQAVLEDGGFGLKFDDLNV